MPSFASLSPAEREAVIAFLFDKDTKKRVPKEALTGGWTEEIPWISTGHHDFRDPEGFPVNKRPWGTLTAINLHQGTLEWQVPLGTYPALEARGLAPTGSFNIGGPLVTAGELIFIGAAMDERFHAFDRETGRLLWEYPMEAGGYASPATYAIEGRQYVLIAAGGAGKPGTKAGNAYYCFALPEPAQP
jgi:quinoprotein glucose dehydrogenase